MARLSSVRRAAVELRVGYPVISRQVRALQGWFGRRHPAGDLFFGPTLLVNANDTRAGLAAYVYTGSLNQYYHVSEALEYGMVGVNTGFISTEVAPFGGVKESGMGREGSRHGIDDYLDFKTITIGGL